MPSLFQVDFTTLPAQEALAERMNICSVDFPPGTSELGAAGLTAAPGAAVLVPRIAEAVASLECRHLSDIGSQCASPFVRRRSGLSTCARRHRPIPPACT